MPNEKKLLYPLDKWKHYWKICLLECPKNLPIYDDLVKLNKHHIEAMSKFNAVILYCQEQEVERLYLQDRVNKILFIINKTSLN